MEKKAILITYPSNFILQEALGLAEAAGYSVSEIVTQRYLSRAKYGVGSGKAEEIKQIVKELEVQAILFDTRLKSVQIYNLARLCGVEVIDREKLILEIFYRRASTSEAKLQVQLAELTYEMPRAREKVRLAKAGEHPGFYGLGGYEAEVYYRAIRRRISSLTDKMWHISRRRELHRVQRQRMNIPTISLSGYTGAGKTTLFNKVTGEQKDVDKGVFTTLTTSTRAIHLSGLKALLSDTVGFINRLPTYMIEAFKSTLEELTYANLVLLVIDASEPFEDMVKRYESCMKILSELQVSPSKVLLIFNKADLTSVEDVERKIKSLGVSEDLSVIISAKTGLGIDRLKSKIYWLIFECSESKVTLQQEEVQSLSDHLDWLRKNAEVELVRQTDGTLTAIVRGPSWAIERFKASRRSEA